jgi:aspartate beta-hydroxylase
VTDTADEAVVTFLESEGAGKLIHRGGRALLDHLVETSRIVRRWGQPEWLARAALTHSVYGTEAFRPKLVSIARRDEVAAVAGVRAERLAYLFSVTPRRPLLAGTHLWARDLPSFDAQAAPPTSEELDALVVLHLANLAEQARAPDGSPARWLVRAHLLAELLPEGDRPAFAVQLVGFEASDEALTRSSYLEALRGDGRERGSLLALAASACAAVPEPCVWLAVLSRCRGEEAASGAWAAQARKRLWALGTAWDKRLSFDEWLALIDALYGGAAGEADQGVLGDPRALFEVLVDECSPRTHISIAPIDADAGRRRFRRYVEGFMPEGLRRPGLLYPDLPSRPWHDPSDFPLVAYLESHFDEIRAELLALSASRFHSESERIGRTGDWDVAFLYERGRRRDEVCAACPVTTRGIETHRTVRTMAGLIYVSRMRAHTHIDAHRGPTNVRVRCHLGIDVPDGDCAIRVGHDTRHWTEGRCLVFDDHFEHEAWNHSDTDRVVLIVDLWHPGLSDTEVMLLEGLQRYAHAHAERLAGYWSANARAARDT